MPTSNPNPKSTSRRSLPPVGLVLVCLVSCTGCGTEPAAEPFVFQGNKSTIATDDLYFGNEILIADETTRFQPSNVGFFDIDQNGFPDLLLGRDQVGEQKPEQVRILRNRSWVTREKERANFAVLGYLSRRNSTAFVPDG